MESGALLSSRGQINATVEARKRDGNMQPVKGKDRTIVTSTLGSLNQ